MNDVEIEERGLMMIGKSLMVIEKFSFLFGNCCGVLRYMAKLRPFEIIVRYDCIV